MSRPVRTLTIAVALVSLATTSCGPKRSNGPSVAPDAPARADAANDEDAPTLAEIADAIDPGPRPALTVGTPAWISAALGLADAPREPGQLLQLARAAFEKFEIHAESDDGDLQGIVELVRALGLAERAAGTLEDAPVEVLLVLERTYEIMDAPALANERNLFGGMFRELVTMLASQGHQADAAGLEELASVVRGAVTRAGDLHLRTAAALLRKAPDHEQIPNVLVRVADTLSERDEGLALGTMKRSLLLRGTKATAAHWLDLAASCNRALDVRCGREARAAAQPLVMADDEALQTRLSHGQALADAALRAVELADAPGLEDSVSRGTALFDLGRYAQAREVFSGVYRRHPEDARPVMGMARCAIADGLDFAGALEIIDRAAPREHLDRDWYELAIGVRATGLLSSALPVIAEETPAVIAETLRPSLERIRDDIDALQALGSDEGRVLQFMVGLALEVWPRVAAGDTDLSGVLPGLLPRARALAAELPASWHAYTLMLSAAEFSHDRDASFAVLAVEPAATDDALELRRARAFVDLVVAWDAADHVPAMLGLLDGLGDADQTAEVRRLIVDGHAIAKRLGASGEDWPDLRRRYAAVRERGGAKDPVLLNNLAVATAAMGNPVQAEALWLEALEHATEDDSDIVRLNLVVNRLGASDIGSDAKAEAQAMLQSLAAEGAPAEVRLQAHAWRVVGSAGASARKTSMAALRALAAEEAPNNYRPRLLPGVASVIMRGSSQVGLGYSTTEGMQLQLDVTGVPWLMVQCPVAVPDPRGR
ncbi:MAG: tetratricopeptide repeat protein [Deltaproteobacteria bacterium]|nr:tetratricopeptide repeat protein [Deltaproteobacteria bacterium]